MPTQTLIDLVLQNLKLKELIKFHVKIQPVKYIIISRVLKLKIFASLLKFEITESVLSDISYSRVEDSLDSDKNYEDALDRWEPEEVGTVKRKRTSGISNSNGIRKEIEVIFYFIIYLLNLYNFSRFSQITTTTSNQIVATTTVTMEPFNRNLTATSVIETKPSCLFPTPSAPPISGKTSSNI